MRPSADGFTVRFPVLPSPGLPSAYGMQLLKSVWPETALRRSVNVRPLSLPPQSEYSIVYILS